MIHKRKMEWDAERTKDYAIILNIFTGALMENKSILDEELEIVEFIIWKRKNEKERDKLYDWL